MTAAAAQYRARLLLCLAIVYLVWGSSYLATSIGVHALPPFLFGGFRFVVGGLLLYAVARAMGRGRVTLDALEWRHLFVVGTCSVLLSNGFNVWGMQWVASHQSALLNASAAFWIALLGMFGARAHPLSAMVWAGLLLGFGGVALIVWPDAARGVPEAVANPALGPPPLHPLVPDLGILVGCFGWALGTIYMRNANIRLDILSFTGLQMFVGGLMLTAIGFARGEWAQWTWSAPGLVSMAYLTIFSSCIAYTAYAWLSQNAPPAQVGTYGFVNPAIATFLGWAVLDERLGLAQIVGMIVILAGVLLVTWPGTKAATAGAATDSAPPAAAPSSPRDP